MTDFLSLAQARYSARGFEAREVEAEKIATILEAVRVAPSAVNKQPWFVWVVSSEEAKARLNGCSKYNFCAPITFVVGYRTEEAWTRRYDNHNHAEIDACIAATHLMLAAADLGLGTTWIGNFDPEALAQALPETAGYTILGYFPCGYPSADKGLPSERHLDRKALEEMSATL
ncbi:MAG: nitroreductase family protein [Bacteroidales bacterium]|nr:nitroreductase family protein [Bacteroidales bacterium]